MNYLGMKINFHSTFLGGEEKERRARKSWDGRKKLNDWCTNNDFTQSPSLYTMFILDSPHTLSFLHYESINSTLVLSIRQRNLNGMINSNTFSISLHLRSVEIVEWIVISDSFISSWNDLYLGSAADKINIGYLRRKVLWRNRRVEKWFVAKSPVAKVISVNISLHLSIAARASHE